MEKKNMNINVSYIDSPDYYLETTLPKLDLDEEREDDLANGRGFVITTPQGIKKDFKNPDSIYSTRFGQTLQDVNPSKYRCRCGNLVGRLNNELVCPLCHTVCHYVGNNFNYFGWIILNDYYFIHPTYYRKIAFFIGEEKLINILKVEDRKDENGFSIETEKKKDEPYAGLGMIGFKEKFNEIMEFYLKLKPNKKPYYDEIMEGTHYLNKKRQIRNIVFAQSIPVYTTLLRPFRVDGNQFTFEGTNAIFNLMAKLAKRLNENKYSFGKKLKPKNLLLFDLQTQYMKLYEEIINILAKKKGRIRSSFGGRYNFTARSIIVSDPKLKIDEVRLSYYALGELLQQTIINILQKSFNCSYTEAYLRWKRSQIEVDSIVYNIIENIISSQDRGLAVLINRNPTINYGGIMQMYCIGIQKESYTMAVPLQILSPLAADFDGDTLNILLIINEEFKRATARVFNPRNAMYVSRNDGYFNNAVNFAKDSIMTMDSFIRDSRENYSSDQLSRIELLKNMK